MAEPWVTCLRISKQSDPLDALSHSIILTPFSGNSYSCHVRVRVGSSSEPDGRNFEYQAFGDCSITCTYPSRASSE